MAGSWRPSSSTVALPRDARATTEYNHLANGLGKNTAIEVNGLSATLPKPSPPPKKQTAAPAGPRSGGKSNKKAGNLHPRKSHTTAEPSTAFELRQIACAVRRIHDPMRSNPEAVYAAKDHIAARLIRIADTMEAAHG